MNLLRLVICLGMLAVPISALAQTDFSGNWELVDGKRTHVSISPIGESGAIEHTQERLSWRNLERPTQFRNYDLAVGKGTLRTDGGAIRAYIVRQVGLALVIEEDFGGGTNLTILSLNNRGDLDIVVVLADIQGGNITERFTYRRVK